MKKNIILTVLVFLLAATAVFAQGGKEADDGQFHIKGNVDFYVSSSSGGGSDIITRTITDIASKNGIVDAPFIVYNQPDGNGQISRRTVSTARNADSTLLCFSSGDLSAMIQNGGLTLDDFRPLVILAADKHLCFVNAEGKYSSFEEIMEAVKNGQKINVGGTMSDERVVFNMLCEELGTKDSFTYITYGSASESIAALLGNHVDIAISKPAAANQYVIAGDIIPVFALSTTRFGAPFDTAPTLSELGYNDVEYPMWRGVIGAKNMSDEAVAFWADAFKKVSETEEWQKNYLERNLLVSQYMGPEEASAVMYEAQAAAQAQN